MLKEQINTTIDEWIAILNHYSFDNLLKKPDEETWSLGQVAEHIISESDFYLSQIEDCLISNENSSNLMTERARAMFDHNAFPDIKIRRDASLSACHPQPKSKADVLRKMQVLKKSLNDLLTKIEINECKGKTKHPGLGYFNALEWLQFTEMHMRHQLRQKERIELLLQLRSPKA